MFFNISFFVFFSNYKYLIAKQLYICNIYHYHL